MKLPRTDIHNEKGVMLIVLGLAGVLFVAASGLAIDLANLALARAQVRRAADAGVIAGLTVLPDVILRNGNASPAIIKGGVKNTAQNIALVNLRLMGVRLPTTPTRNPKHYVTPNCVFTGDDHQQDQVIVADVKINAEVPTTFAKLLGLGNRGSTGLFSITADPHARRGRAVIDMILDVTGSMDHVTTPTSPSTKIDYLIYATKEFLACFIEGWDYISITLFSTNIRPGISVQTTRPPTSPDANTIVPMDKYGPPSRGFDDICRMIDTTLFIGRIGQNTDYEAGFRLGDYEMRTEDGASSLKYATRYVLFFSDGWPNSTETPLLFLGDCSDAQVSAGTCVPLNNASPYFRDLRDVNQKSTIFAVYIPDGSQATMDTISNANGADASGTQGITVNATDAAGLQKTFKQIASKVGTRLID